MKTIVRCYLGKENLLPGEGKDNRYGAISHVASGIFKMIVSLSCTILQ